MFRMKKSYLTYKIKSNHIIVKIRMNNSYSGNHSPSNLSGNYSRTSSPISKSKKLPRDIDVYGYLEDPAMKLLREAMLRATSFDSVETSELEKLYWHLRDYSYYCGIKSNYDEALETEKLLEYTHLELKERGIKPKSKITSEIMGPAFYQNLQTKYVFFLCLMFYLVFEKNKILALNFLFVQN
ncbi:hypothetical protein TRFO_13526 [Tritrichomonas foetus]|uniref:Uncharacterized protein n=1 Tax=Tritrichomonas foetus TaxID=1144522 RepID=A0A1J4L2B7_9EUKA|nr:hypothetical protein TRFO_13526 [Tritrichomonas foetus]|eukprot:OHT16037.1 hypothetical protein TRFO_13526 [Tritrichomonas foetus]